MKMREMPYRVKEGAIEHAKYRAKMAVREVANPKPSVITKRRLQWQWIGAAAAVTAVVMGVFGFVKLLDERMSYDSPMEQLIAEMKSAPDEIISDWAADVNYYQEDASSL